MEYGPGNKPWRMPLRHFIVVDAKGDAHPIDAHYVFNNGGEGLIFRRYPKGSDRSDVTAAFAEGAWLYYKED
jgi:hypothetical protein